MDVFFCTTFNIMMRKNIPFDFIFDYLITLDIKTKPMFGLWAIYLDDKIMLILRQRDKNQEMNGVWIATSQEFHNSLRKDIPSLTSITPNTLEDTEWQLIPENHPDFETSVRKACELILNHDIRIGRIPKPKKKKG